jgi:hypothetical protein
MAGWTATGTYGVNTAGSGTIADNGAVPDQDNVAFLLGNSSLSQTIRNVKIGSPVKVTFAYNAKSGESPHLQVKHGETVVLEEDVVPWAAPTLPNSDSDFHRDRHKCQLPLLRRPHALLDDIKVEAEAGVEFAPIAFDPTGVEMARRKGHGQG